MIKKILAVFAIFLCGNVFAADQSNTDINIFNTTEITDTECATAVLADALQSASHTVNEYTSEQDIRAWIYDVFMSAETISDVLSCPELEDADENTTIKFMPIKYTFTQEDEVVREIVINYETQVKILEQRLKLATKRELPSDTPSPDIDPNDPNATWVNTDPAWYAVMVTQPGALAEFVGKDKNNTISFKWIMDNIDNLYPKDMDGVCSTRSGIGAKINHAMVHRVIHEKTAKRSGDKNNYYVAGDIDLRWVSWAEVALDIAITVVTWGAGAAATGALKGARAAKTMGQLAKNMKRLTKLDNVKDYVRASVKVAKAERNVENLAKVEKSVANISKLEQRLAKTAKGTKQYDRIADQLRAARQLHADNLAKMGKDAEKLGNIKDVDKLSDMSKASKKEIEETKKLMEQMAKNDKNVAEYAKNFDSLKDISKYAKDLKAFKQKPKTGNIISRAWQRIKNGRTTLKAIHGGTKRLDKAAKVARHGMKSGRVRDWLFHSTRRNLARITRVTEDVAALSLIIGFIGDFYDRTEVSTDEFSNGIEMKPFLLLSGDSIEGQDNIVNYGMWLMWSGDSTSAEDDDAAYLQAMDFAQKFYQDLNETQAEEGKYSCDVDIYVVRPVIRNPGTASQELYWLIMNDEPWTTAKQAP